MKNLDMLTSYSFFPKITLPARLSENSGTLIDNFICKLLNNSNKTTSGIIVCQISDHLPYFISIDYNIRIKHDAPSKYIRVRQINVASINNFKSAISNSNIYNKLNDDANADPDANYAILDETITSAINTYLPVKLIKYNKQT